MWHDSPDRRWTSGSVEVFFQDHEEVLRSDRDYKPGRSSRSEYQSEPTTEGTVPSGTGPGLPRRKHVSGSDCHGQKETRGNRSGGTYGNDTLRVRLRPPFRPPEEQGSESGARTRRTAGLWS